MHILQSTSNIPLNHCTRDVYIILKKNSAGGATEIDGASYFIPHVHVDRSGQNNSPNFPLPASDARSADFKFGSRNTEMAKIAFVKSAQLNIAPQCIVPDTGRGSVNGAQVPGI